MDVPDLEPIGGSTPAASRPPISAPVEPRRRGNALPSDSGSEEGNESWDDWVDDDETADAAICLFCDYSTPIADLDSHMANSHSFSLQDTANALQLDFYGTVRLINYIRSMIKSDPGYTFPSPAPDFKSSLLAEDCYLTPIMQDDALIMSVLDTDDAVPLPVHSRSTAPHLESHTAPAFEPTTTSPPDTRPEEDLDRDALLARLEAAERRAKDVETGYLQYKEMVRRTFFDEEDSESGSAGSGAESQPNGAAAKRKRRSKAVDRRDGEPDEVESYFSSYAGLEIHETMLKDRVRTEAYRDFMYLNKHIFQGKVVLDVGCGTGILSMFAARAGARRVYAVDNSDIVERAKQIVKENELQDVVTVVRGRIEEVTIPEGVDLIVSEWMGYYLLFEGMLDSVLSARDRLLVPGGLVAPGSAEVYLSLWSDSEWIDDNVGFFSDVYGFSMRTLTDEFYREGQVTVVSKASIISDLVLVKAWDLHTCTASSLDFTSTVRLQTKSPGKVYGLCLHFDVQFAPIFFPDGTNVRMTTSPLTQPTHWKQGLLLLRDPFEVASEGEVVEVELSMCKGLENMRELEVSARVRSIVQSWYVR